MEKTYELIKFGFGDIESAIRELKSYSTLVCGRFNGTMLYSDIDDVNSAYLKICGVTKEQFDADRQREDEEYLEKVRLDKEVIPELTVKYIELGKQILDKKYMVEWVKCVPIRLDDLYQGMELQMCLDIVKELNNGCSLEKAKEIIDNQGHSGTSYYLVLGMVKCFCDRGKDLYDYNDKVKGY